MRYENLPIQYSIFFSAVLLKNEIIYCHWEKMIFLIKMYEILIVGTRKNRARGGHDSNKYPQSMFWIKTEKNMYIPLYTTVLLQN